MRPRGSRFARVVALLCVLALGAAACGDSDSDSDAGDGNGDTTETTAEGDDGTEPTDGEGDSDDSSLPDPCSLLTAADFNAATGLAFGEGTFNEDLSAPDRQICDWLSDDPFATGQVLISTGAAYQTSRDGVEQAFGEPADDATVAGADDAYVTQEGSLVGMLVGDLFIQVSYLPPGPGEVADITLGLAATAVANLG